MADSQDIAERAQAEGRQAVDAFLVQNVHDAIVATDKDFILTAWNRAAEEMYGWTADEVAGRDVREVVRAEYPEERRVEALRILAETGRYRTQAVHRRKDGRLIHVDGSAMALKGAAGLVIGYVFAYHDITERNRTQEALRKQNEVLQAIIDNIPVMIRLLGPEARIRSVNRTWEQTLGWSLEEVQQRGFSLFDELYPDPLERQRALAFVAAATGEWADFRLRARDGRVIDATFANIRLSDGTNISIGQDLTERKRGEERLRETAEQLRALSARITLVREEEATRIAREIHDELGSALTSLRWDLMSLESTIAKSGERSLIQLSQEKINSMLRLTETTINVVRRISSELRPGLLDDLGLAEAIESQTRQYQVRTGLECRCDCSLENSGLGQAQSTALFRIFQEALTNIARHAQATRVDVGLREEEGHVVLTISDDGRGITEKEISNPQALGLLGMRERALAVAGKVDITGVKRRGTRVTVRVPIPRNLP